MNHPLFHSANLVYRAAEPDTDYPLIRTWLSDPATLTSFRDSPSFLPPGLDLLENLKEAEKGTILNQMVCLPKSPTEPKTPGQAIGLIRLHAYPDGYFNHRASFSILFDPTHQNKGYGTESLTWMLERAFMTLNLNRVESKVLEDHLAARRCYEKLGFVEEGTAREASWGEGEWKNHVYL